MRLVPEAHRGVVTRLGRTRRVVGPGAVFVVPGLDRVERLSMAPERIEPLVVCARTADHVDVRIEGSAVYRVIDPAAAVAAVPSALTKTQPCHPVGATGAGVRLVTEYLAGG